MRGIVPMRSAVGLPAHGRGFVQLPRPSFPRGTGLVLSIVGVAVLLAVALAYGTVVAARALGYRVVVTEHAGQTTGAGSLLFVRTLPLSQAERGQRILVRDPNRGRATIEVERIASLRRVHGAIVADTERADASSERRRSILTRRVIVPAGSIPQLGYLVALLTSPIGWLLALALPAAGLAASALRRIWAIPDPPIRGISVPRPGDDKPPVMRPRLGADPLKETP